jgi:hypothetical protein
VIEVDAPIYRQLPVDVDSMVFMSAVNAASDAIGAVVPGFVRVVSTDYNVRADRRKAKAER